VSDETTPMEPKAPASDESASLPGATASKPVGRLRTVAVSAVVGGLVGALAAGGVFVATDDGGGTTTVVRPSATPAVVTRPSSSVGSESDIAAIIAKAEPAVVAITTDDGPGTGSGGAGTGFVISADGYVVSNNHVVEGADKIEVAFTNGNTMSAKIVGRDPSADLAVLKVDGTNLPAIELGDSDAVQVGDDVVAIGNALALEGGLSVTRGIISGTDRNVDPDGGVPLVGLLQTDAAINPGNSGGPLLDGQGRVIGVNTAIAGGAQNVGFAIPISLAKPTIDDLRAGRKPAFLGVSTQTVTAAAATELKLAVNEGAYVVGVTSGTPAADAGIKEGDVIVQIGDATIKNTADVQAAVRSHRPGDSVQVVVNRKGDRQTFDAKLVERPDSN
jgi:S1-C subfamily serine protease